MPDPVYYTEVEFTTGSYTDISSDCYKVSINTALARGVGDSISIPELTVILDNKNRQYTVQNSSSPYYPNLRIGKKVRVRASYNGSAYGLFSGMINTWLG